MTVFIPLNSLDYKQVPSYGSWRWKRLPQPQNSGIRISAKNPSVDILQFSTNSNPIVNYFDVIFDNYLGSDGKTYEFIHKGLSIKYKNDYVYAFRDTNSSGSLDKGDKLISEFSSGIDWRGLQEHKSSGTLTFKPEKKAHLLDSNGNVIEELQYFLPTLDTSKYKDVITGKWQNSPNSGNGSWTVDDQTIKGFYVRQGGNNQFKLYFDSNNNGRLDKEDMHVGFANRAVQITDNNGTWNWSSTAKTGDYFGSNGQDAGNITFVNNIFLKSYM